MKRYKFLSLLLVSVSMLTISCQKEGPAGPAGPAGPTGAAGASGPVGLTGPAGTANVIYSAWFLTGTGWTATGAAVYGARFLFDKATASITQTIMDQGVVLGYIKGEPNTAGINSQVFQLPYGVGVGAGFFDQYELMLNAPGNVRFLYKSDAPWTAAELAPISFRYVIIPGALAGGRMMSGSAVGCTVEQLKAMPYDQVLKKFNIPSEGSNQ